MTVETADGKWLSADFAEPVSGRLGTVVFVHGFCGTRSENGLFDQISTLCAQRGLGTIMYDWRGMGESGGVFYDTTIEQHATDFGCVVAHAKRLYGTPVYAVGFSLGAALVGLAVRSGAVNLRSAAFLSPAMRPAISMWPRYEHLWDVVARGPVAKPGSHALIGKSILSSLRDTDLGPGAFDLGIPLLVYHGTADTRIACSHSREIARRCNDSSHLKYVELDGASHSLRPEEVHWKRVARETSSWFHDNTPDALRASIAERGLRAVSARLGTWRRAA